MTVLADQPAAGDGATTPPGAAERPTPVRRLPSLVPWGTVVAATLVALHVTGTPGTDVVAYAAYWALAVILPGTLVYRAVRGSRGNLPEDISFGAATGLVLELLWWAVAAALQLQPLLRWCPLLVVVLFAAVPRLRPHWRVQDPRPLPLAWAWGVAGVLLLVVGWAAAAWAALPLPPATATYYQDLLYHLALVQELTRSMPFEVPQLAGEPLRYHFLGNAHMAVASMVTGTSPETVLFRLWVVPVAATAVLLTAALARDLSGRWWTGPLAGGLAGVGLPMTLGAPAGAPGGAALLYNSPSLIYGLPPTLLLASLVTTVLRGQRLGLGWMLVPATALACAGAKASILPPLLVGVVAAGSVCWWRARAVPWPVLGLMVTVLAAMVTGLKLFAGGGAGTLSVQALSQLTWFRPYREAFGARASNLPDGFIMSSFLDTTTAGRIFLLSLLGWCLAMQLPRLLGLLWLVDRQGRSEPSAWFLAGSVAAGTGASWLFWHPSSSQIYFFTGVIPLAATATACWFAAHAVRHRGASIIGIVAGAVYAVAAPRVPPPTPNTASGWAWALTRPVLTAAAVALVVVLVVLAVRAVRRGRFGIRVPGVGAGLVAAVLGVSLGTGAWATVTALHGAATLDTPGPAGPYAVTADEVRAAMWLDRSVPVTDIVATNVHCQPVRTTPNCDARAFWVGGFGGRRILVESWGYSDQAVSAHGRDGLPYVLQPAPDQDTFALNQRVFTDPSATDLTQLRARGVRWLFADTRAGVVSPRLADLAFPRYRAGSVTVYEIR